MASTSRAWDSSATASACFAPSRPSRCRRYRCVPCQKQIEDRFRSAPIECFHRDGPSDAREHRAFPSIAPRSARQGSPAGPRDGSATEACRTAPTRREEFPRSRKLRRPDCILSRSIGRPMTQLPDALGVEQKAAASLQFPVLPLQQHFGITHVAHLPNQHHQQKGNACNRANGAERHQGGITTPGTENLLLCKRRRNGQRKIGYGIEGDIVHLFIEVVGRHLLSLRCARIGLIGRLAPSLSADFADHALDQRVSH